MTIIPMTSSTDHSEALLEDVVAEDHARDLIVVDLAVAGLVAVGHDQVERVLVDDVWDVRVLEALEHLLHVHLRVYRTPLDSTGYG